MSANIGLWEHFARLFDFQGREDRASFWPYAATVFIIVTIAGMIAFVPMMAHAMQAQQQAWVVPTGTTAGPGPSEIVVHAPPPHLHGHHRAHLRPFPSTWLAIYFAITFGLAILLYSAAVVRRLHDRGLAGWWGLMPLPFVFYSSLRMPSAFAATWGGHAPDTAVFLSIFVSNLLYLVSLIVLVVLLASAGDAGPNRFDQPA